MSEGLVFNMVGGGGGIKLDSIAVTTPPTKTSYLSGERFDPSGMVVTATYSNGAKLAATGYTVEPSGPLSDGMTSVTIRYTEGGVTKTTLTPVTVERKIVQETLNDNSWATISSVSAESKGANYWAVGDCKSVTLSGTVGTLSVSGTYWVYILGFNHNSDIEGEGIQFGTFKTAQTGGTDVCLVDSEYDSTFYSGTKYFNLNHWGRSTTPYNTNYGGWAACDARYDILGSTDKQPSVYGSTKKTSAVGYDASTTTATNPVANTLMAALPSDLRAVMKPITKYTDAVGNKSDTQANVKASVDYLPLLAEFEIFGTRIYANTYEQNYQKQYQYFINGNSKVKCQHSSTGSLANWWERSPYYNNAYYFCAVAPNGNAGNSTSRYSYGLAPAFMV